MLLRRPASVAALALATLATLACEPEVPQDANTTTIDYAVFDPTASQIPLPNELALLPEAIAGQKGAQQELLQSFAAAGGFPADSELTVTVDFVRQTIKPDGSLDATASPPLDLSSIKADTLAVLSIDANGAVTKHPTDALVAADFVAAANATGQKGTLSIRRQKPGAAARPPWPAGSRVVVALRGYGAGVKTTDGKPVYPQPTTYLLTQGQDLTIPENQTIIPGNSRAEKAATAARLEGLRKTWVQPLQAVDTVFPSKEAAVVVVFRIAPERTRLAFDAATGSVPFPSDFLLDPVALLGGTKKVKVPTGPTSPFGPLATGLNTLDGFSTTAALIMPLPATPTQKYVKAATVNKDTVFVYELSANGQTATMVDPSTLEFEPSAIVQSGLSNIIVVQPASPNSVTTPLGKPLKEGTTYVVLVTNGVQDIDNKPFVRNSPMNFLLFSNPLIVGNQLQLSGPDVATATLLEYFRKQINVAVNQLTGTDRTSFKRTDIVGAYTTTTQTFKGTAVSLSAVPYAVAAAIPSIKPSSVTSSTAAEAFVNWGIEAAVVPSTDIDLVMEAKIPTKNALSPATGALEPDATKWTTELIDVLVALPKTAAVTQTCTSPSTLTKCAPLVIFHHGLGGSRGSMLLTANELTKKGFIVAAIDAPKHGDRSWCSANNQCASGGTCTAIPGAATQGDAVVPGTCSTSPVKTPLFCREAASGSGCLVAWAGAGSVRGSTPISSQYFVSGNLFRTRDTIRQDIIDHAFTILALAGPHTGGPGPGGSIPAGGWTHDIQTQANARGYAIDFAKVYWLGQSLGAITGVMNTAANARIQRLAASVGGATLVDAFVTSPSLSPSLNAVLAGLGIAPGTPAYYQFIQVAKWVLDPADAINYAVNVKTAPLASPLLGGATQPSKDALQQMALCDTTIPNAMTILLNKNLQIGPVSASASRTPTYLDPTSPPAGPPFTATCPLSDPTAGGAVPTGATASHSFLTNWGLSITRDATGVPTASSQDAEYAILTARGQAHLANFLNDNTVLPPPAVTPATPAP